MKKVVAFLLALAVVCGGALSASAQEMRQIVTVSAASFDSLTKTVATIGGLVGKPGLDKMLEGAMDAQGAGAMLKAVDKAKPWGAVVKCDEQGQNFVIQGFLPIKNFKDALKSIPNAPPVQDEDGLMKIAPPTGQGRAVYLKQVDAWVVVSDKKESLAKTPADPAKELKGLDAKYLVAVEASVKDVPAALKTKGLEAFKGLIAMAQMMQGNQPPEQAAMQQKMLEQSAKQIETLANELDTVLIGLKFDDSSNAIKLNVAVTAIPDSKTAKKIAAAESKTNLAGLILPDAAVALSAAQKVDAEDAAQIKDQIAMLKTSVLKELEKQTLPEEQGKVAKKIVGDLFDVLEKSFSLPNQDIAFSLKLDAGGSLLLAGMQLAERAKLEGVVKTLVEQLAKEDKDAAAMFKLNAEQHAGVALHVLSIPLAKLGAPDSEKEKITKLLGDPIQVVLGVSDTNAYLAGGKDAVIALKSAIDSSKAQANKATSPMQFVIKAGAILKFAAAVVPEGPKGMVEGIAKTLEGSAGKDQIKITVAVIPNGSQVEFEVQEGILKLIGVGVSMAGGGM